MKRLGIIVLGNQSLAVEYDDLTLEAPSDAAVPVPEGGKPAGFAEAMKKASELAADSGAALRNIITAIAQATSEALGASDPNEWSVEINVGFVGKLSPIPTIVSGETNASIK